MPQAKQEFYALSARMLNGRWKLPPLILHPFSGDKAAGDLLEASRASMMLHGMVPQTSVDKQELARLVLKGRYQEIKMLYFLGKDLNRWMEQCLDAISRTEELAHAGIREQSFAAMLVEAPPPHVAEKLVLWGVTDQRSIFSRAIGLNVLLNEAPGPVTLTDTLMLNYHRFADHLYACYLHLVPFTPIRAENFEFEIYGSAEYSRILAQEWDRAEQTQ